MTREPNAPAEEMPDVPTAVCSLPVKRMFEESHIIEAIERVESTIDIRGSLRALSINLFLMWC